METSHLIFRHESTIKEKTQKSSHSKLQSTKCLPNAAGDLWGAVSPPADPGLSPGGGQGGQSPHKISHIFL